MPVDVEEYLWRMYAENTGQGRHHEIQRANVTGFMLLVGTALIGVITFDKSVSGRADAIVAAFMMAVGLFGSAFVLKHYERFRLHMTRAREYRDRLDTLLKGQPLKGCKSTADAKHRKEWPHLEKIHTAYWWVALNSLVFLIGATLFAFSLLNPP